MDNFNLYLPTEYLFGKNVEKEIGVRLKALGATKVLLHSGSQSAERSGLLSRVRESLKDAKLAFLELAGVMPNPRMDLAYEGIGLCRSAGCDAVLAVGGGSVIDSAKCIAAGACYEGDVWDLYSGKGKLERTLLIATIPTLPAAGSEGSASSVMSLVDANNQVWKRGMAGDAIRPRLSLINPELTYTLPPIQTAAGAADIFAHVMERYFTRSQGGYLTEQFCEALFRTVVHYAPIALAEPQNYEARAELSWASVMAHNNVAGVGREQDWASHGIEHELSALYDAIHGEGLAVVIPAWMRYVYKIDPARFERFGREVFGLEAKSEDPEVNALAAISALEEFFSSLGLARYFEDLGGREEDIELLADRVAYDRESLRGRFKRLNREDVKQIYALMRRPN